MNPEVLTCSGLCFLLKGEVVMAPVRSEGCCVRPFKPPNPSFNKSFSFPLFLLHWVVREALRERGMSGCAPGSCWAPQMSLGEKLELGCLSGDAPEWCCLTDWDAQARGSKQSKHGWFVCVCLHIRAQLPCLLVSEHEGKGTASGHQPPLVKRYLNQSSGCVFY